MNPPRAFLSWSSGKDSAFALHEARRLGVADIVGVLTTVSEENGRVAVHPCPNHVYERELAAACDAIKAQGVTHIVYGDLFLADIRAYREAMLAPLGMTPLFPLWGRDTRTLAHDMMTSGMEARIVCVDLKRLDLSFAGRTFDASLLADLPPGVDPCGENGEFHTLATNGPMFARPIDVELGEITSDAGFGYADLLPR
jgi:diphthamide synthase (EF-2-diphthine--ammonia ligase)